MRDFDVQKLDLLESGPEEADEESDRFQRTLIDLFNASSEGRGLHKDRGLVGEFTLEKAQPALRWLKEIQPSFTSIMNDPTQMNVFIAEYNARVAVKHQASSVAFPLASWCADENPRVKRNLARALKKKIARALAKKRRRGRP